MGKHDAFGASCRPRGIHNSGERVGRDMQDGFRTSIRRCREPLFYTAHALVLLAQGLVATKTQHKLQISQSKALPCKTQPMVITVDEQQARAGVGKNMSGGRGSVGREQGHNDQAKRQCCLVEAHPFDALLWSRTATRSPAASPLLPKGLPPAMDEYVHIVPRETQPIAWSGIVFLVSNIGAAMLRTTFEEIRHGSCRSWGAACGQVKVSTGLVWSNGHAVPAGSMEPS